MQYVPLGRSGLKVSRFALGCMSYGDPGRGWNPWVLTEEQGRPLIRAAIEAGINFFDTANIYSAGASEEVLGRAIKDFTRRDEVVIATKVNGPMNKGANAHGLSRKSILTEVDQSLRRLGTDYIDLYQIHAWDPNTPIEETLDALDDIVRAGKVRYLGASNSAAWQLCQALYVAKGLNLSRFVSMQIHLNLLYREEEREMLPLCADQGIGVIPWSPLARGLLARPWSDEPTTERAKTDTFGKSLYDRAKDADRAVVDAVGEVAERIGASRSEVALAWLLTKPEVTAPIVGVTKPHHLDGALKALDLTLDAELIQTLEERYVPHEKIGL
jgi:aryl-alcohol dehydrogenase-like predicted oxidoreductase